MITKNQIKYINSLQQKKFRSEHQSFIVEGAKSVLELLKSDFELELLFVTQDFFNNYEEILQKLPIQVELVNQQDLEKSGSYSSNNAALAVAKTKENEELLVGENEYALILDDIRDPGNLGTIIRVGDWYGIHKIICSHSTVDFYNPKVIAATMGSFTRTKLYYTDLEEFINKQSTPIYGTLLNGNNIHQTKFAKSGYIIIGNEANGISEDIEKLVTDKITIPSFGGAESLNAGIATAVVLDNLRR
ncbi:RNA methyltransferase [Arcicella sp. LKC2W]|uniref:TrmH family RNA methyltransferase n=1 Tax=Arcicella sp. LKC2W TaxID=2984198 RepID=UPI002B1F9F69|nr:RNA methyltransferase [Arcicella sp. LKC2W]MEA5457531.1 RNA methyltransferase [Arcicella sp. LKC2W]